MRKDFKETVIETRITHSEYYCDKCGNKIEKHFYDVFELSLRTGSAYPEGGSGDVELIDLCPECVKSMFDLLKANGFNITKEEWDW